MSPVSHHPSVESMIPDAFLQCRDLAHSFRPYDATIDRRAREIRRELRCPECGTVKIQLLDLEGYVLRSWYTYPSGYLILGLGRMSVADRAAIRFASTMSMTRGGQS